MEAQLPQFAVQLARVRLGEQRAANREQVDVERDRTAMPGGQPEEPLFRLRLQLYSTPRHNSDVMNRLAGGSVVCAAFTRRSGPRSCCQALSSPNRPRWNSSGGTASPPVPSASTRPTTIRWSPPVCTAWIVQSIQAAAPVRRGARGRGRVVGDTGELVRAAHREATAQLALVRAEYVHAEDARAGDPGPGRRRTADHERDQRRVQGEGGEGLAGEAGGVVVRVLGGELGGEFRGEFRGVRVGVGVVGRPGRCRCRCRCGDHRDACREVPQDPPECGLVDRRALVLADAAQVGAGQRLDDRLRDRRPAAPVRRVRRGRPAARVRLQVADGGGCHTRVSHHAVH